ncbi:MAG: GDP-mannose 4,6-dehydratase [Patescibacteria group bacterium]
MKTALITGITGQDGSYLAEFLLEKGYKVYGLTRRASVSNVERIQHLLDKIELLDGDLLDLSSLIMAIRKSNPDEIYNLAAQSFVGTSFVEPYLTSQITGVGALNMFEAARLTDPKVKIYQASSSEMFGKVRATPQNEDTPFHPRSPYGVAKVFAHYAGMNYRESYDMFICSGILFNHESPRRGEEFVTRKISRGVAKIHLGLAKELTLGNLDAKRDWGFAGDYVKAMWMMLQQEKPEDYVIGTGETHSIRDFLDAAFKVVGIADWKPYVKIDERLYRPAEVDLLIADSSKAKKELGWEPEMSFQSLVELMVKEDLQHFS